MKFREHLEVKMAKFQASESTIMAIIIEYMVVSGAKPELEAAAILVERPGKVKFWPAPRLQENTDTTKTTT